MDIQKEEYLPDASLSREEMEEMQEKIAEDAIFENKLDFEPEDIESKTAAGIDQAFLDDKAISAVVVMEEGEVVEKVYAVEDLEMPYIPGLLAFREASAIVSALEKLESDPDLMMLDGSGRIHYREAGIATHIGVMYDKPAIGVAKSLLCGETKVDVDELERGERVEVYSDNRVQTVSENKLIGYAFQSRQYENSTKINPLYVSPGHRVSAETAVEIVEKLGGDYKLPEPTRLADKYVDEVKKSL